MPREASSSQSSAIAGPGPATIASRSASVSTSSASASASRSSSTRSSPANDLFRISLPDHTDGFFGPVAIENIRKRFAEAGSARFQDILQEASLALKARFAALDSSDSPLSEKEKKKLFDEFLREMRQIAELQEREVEARTHEEAVFAKTLVVSRSENTSGQSGSGSAISSSSASGSSSSSGAGTSGSSGFSLISPSSPSSNASTRAASVKDLDDGSSTEEETDRPTAAKVAKSKGTKVKAGKLPPSLNTASNVKSKPSSIASKKGVSKDDDALSSSPSTPTPGRRGRSGTISLPRSVSASSAFTDDSASASSASSHSKSKSSDSASAPATANTKISANRKENTVEGKTKGASKSAAGSPHVNTRSELLAGSGPFSSSAAPAQTPAKPATTKNTPVPQNQHQKSAQIQRGPTAASVSATQPSATSKANSNARVQSAVNANANAGLNNAKKVVAQQNSDNNNNTSNLAAASRSPAAHSQTFQLAQAHLQHAHQQTQQAHSQNKKSMVVTTDQDDSTPGNRSNKENSVNANHKLWIPPKPPHMQNPANANPKEVSTTAKEVGKDAKESKEGKDGKDGGKEKKARPVSLASQGVGALNLTTSPSANVKEAPTSVPAPVSVSGSTAEQNEKGNESQSQKSEKQVAKAGGGKKGVITEEGEKKISTPASVSTSVGSTSTPGQNSGSVAAKSSTAAVAVSGNTTGAPAQPGKVEIQPPNVPPAAPTSTSGNIPVNAANGAENVKSSAITSATSFGSTEKKAGTATASPQSCVASVPPTPNMLASGLSCASSSEAAAAEIERERLREKEWTMIGIGRDGKPPLQTPASPIMTLPYAYTQSATHAHAHAHAPSPPNYQKVVSVDTTYPLYTHPSPFAHTSATPSSLSGTTGMMSPSISGSTTSTITTPFSPLSMANGFPTSSSATSAASSRAISRHASSSSSDPHAQKDGYSHLHAHHHHHGHGHGRGKKEKDKIAEAAAALIIGSQPPVQASMFWQPAPNERERERDRSHGRNPSTNNNASHSSSASASAASSRSSSVSRHDAFGGFDPSTIRPSSGRPGQSPLLQAGGLGLGNAGIEAFAGLLEDKPGDKSSHGARAGLDTKIWTPGSAAKDSTPKPPRRSDRERETGISASSPPIHPLSLTLSSFSSSSSTSSSVVPSSGSTISNASTSQSHFYAVAERAREDRLRVRANEFRSRAEVVAVFQRRVEELMAEFAEALTQADDYEKFGPSELTKHGLN